MHLIVSGLTLIKNEHIIHKEVLQMLKEYCMDMTEFYNWLPWGGLVYPDVVRNKDGSLMGFIRYGEEKEPLEMAKEKLSGFSSGWAIWTEFQHFHGCSDTVLTLLWNPKIDNNNGMVQNTLSGTTCLSEDTDQVFQKILHDLAFDISLVVSAEILTYEEILGYLSTALAGRKIVRKMFTPPLYLDAVLSRDIDFHVYGEETKDKNALTIDDRRVSVLTPLGHPNQKTLMLLFHAFQDFDYRFSRRCLFWNADDAMRELGKYMKDWCRMRSSIKNRLMQGLSSDIQGSVTDAFIFYFPEGQQEEGETYLGKIMESIGRPCILENYDRKHVWWGSLPGIFRANSGSLPHGMESLGELLVIGTDERRGFGEHVSA